MHLWPISLSKRVVTVTLDGFVEALGDSVLFLCGCAGGVEAELAHGLFKVVALRLDSVGEEDVKTNQLQVYPFHLVVDLPCRFQVSYELLPSFNSFSDLVEFHE